MDGREGTERERKEKGGKGRKETPGRAAKREEGVEGGSGVEFTVRLHAVRAASANNNDSHPQCRTLMHKSTLVLRRSSRHGPASDSIGARLPHFELGKGVRFV